MHRQPLRLAGILHRAEVAQLPLGRLGRDLQRAGHVGITPHFVQQPLHLGPHVPCEGGVAMWALVHHLGGEVKRTTQLGLHLLVRPHEGVG